jgi:hypothetical protein
VQKTRNYIKSNGNLVVEIEWDSQSTNTSVVLIYYETPAKYHANIAAQTMER